MDDKLTDSSFLDEGGNTDLIRWSVKGDSFVVVDEDEFARKLIPELFKHKNYASFVRQLNMYGFHKKVGLSDNSMRASERKDKSPSEYYHPYFQRNRSNLLWLIQKPKNPQGKASGKGGTRSRQEDTNMEDEVEEPYDIDTPAPINRVQELGGAQRNARQPLMIGDSSGGAAGRAATPSQDQMATIHKELDDIKKNQKMIKEVVRNLARENDRREQAYKNLHDQHESSINAILNFLSTVFRGSLSEGQAPPNFGNVLPSAFPQETQQPGNIVDMGDYNEQNSNQSQPRFRRQPLLLKAPPSGNDLNAPTPTSHSQSHLSLDNGQQSQYYNHQPPAAHSPAVEELFSPAVSNRSSQSPRPGPSHNEANTEQLPEADIMSMINSHNAHNAQNNFTPGTHMEALSHLQSADGKPPLTPNQRHDVLQLMAGSSADSSNNNNALTMPALDVSDPGQFDMTRDQLEFLGNAMKDQEQKLGNLTQSLAPLSPSGSIPGMNADWQYNNSDPLDIDSYFNTGDYFNNNGAADFNFDSSNIPDFDNSNIPDFDLGTGATDEADDIFTNGNAFNGAADERSDRGSGVETLGSSEAPSPAVTVETVPEEQQQEEYGRGKRRKRN